MSTAREGPILDSDTKLWDLPSPRVMPPFFPLPETKIPRWGSILSYILCAKVKTSLFLVTATSAVWVDKIRLWVHRSIKAERRGDRAWRCVNLSQMCNLLPEALPPQPRIKSEYCLQISPICPQSFWILWGGGLSGSQTCQLPGMGVAGPTPAPLEGWQPWPAASGARLLKQKCLGQCGPVINHGPRLGSWSSIMSSWVSWNWITGTLQPIRLALGLRFHGQNEKASVLPSVLKFLCI